MSQKDTKSDGQSGKIAIIVAVIGALATLGAALIQFQRNGNADVKTPTPLALSTELVNFKIQAAQNTNVCATDGAGWTILIDNERVGLIYSYSGPSYVELRKSKGKHTYYLYVDHIRCNAAGAAEVYYKTQGGGTITVEEGAIFGFWQPNLSDPPTLVKIGNQ